MHYQLSLDDLQSIVACGLAADGYRTSAILTGVLLKIEHTGTTICATDGKILVEHKHSCIYDTDLDGSDSAVEIVLPWSADKVMQRTIKELIKDLKALHKKSQYHKAFVTLDLDGRLASQFTLSTDSTSYTFRAIEGNYPSYEKALEVNPHVNVPVLSAEYLALIEKALLLPKVCKSVALVTQGQGKGILIKPCAHDHFAHALIMPVALADNEAEMQRIVNHVPKHTEPVTAS